MLFLIPQNSTLSLMEYDGILGFGQSYLVASCLSFQGCLVFVAHDWALSSRSMFLVYRGARSWTKHSRFGHTSAVLEGTITSLRLLAALLLMKSKILLITFSETARCWLMFSLLSTVTPRSFTAKLFSS